MHKLSFLIVLIACLCMFAEGQLTFTSSWGGGKRSGMAAMACRNDESIAAIYKLIQNEAERFIICQTQKP
ncbi:adipokinetic prohormone type 1-like [Anticarsia gemmatalis]|uniref:adipokinetic prohormone type 1-like n=1 Tax=Anticarsia gemmatalis TaxID=129554 RepID=UPI003F766531